MKWKGQFEINGLVLENTIQTRGFEMTYGLWSGESRERFGSMALLDSGGALLTERNLVETSIQTDHLKIRTAFYANDITATPATLQLKSTLGNVIAERSLSGEIEAGKTYEVIRRDYLTESS